MMNDDGKKCLGKLVAKKPDYLESKRKNAHFYIVLLFWA